MESVPYPNFKDYLLALKTFPSYIELLDYSEKPYKGLACWILENLNRLNSDSQPLPFRSVIVKESGVTESQLNKYFELIYTDIIKLNEANPEKFVKPGQFYCCLNFKANSVSSQFDLGLTRVPLIGESLMFDFIKPAMGVESFYVSEILTLIEDGKQETMIYLKQGNYNLYNKLLKEKAYLGGDISFLEYLEDTSTIQMEELLRTCNGL